MNWTMFYSFALGWVTCAVSVLGGVKLMRGWPELRTWVYTGKWPRRGRNGSEHWF